MPLQNEVTVDKILEELVPYFLKHSDKLENEGIRSCVIKTNFDGDQVIVEIFKVNYFTDLQCAYLLNVFNATNRSVSDKWETFSHEVFVQPIVGIDQENSLNKYVFSAENKTSEDLARKNYSKLFFL